MLIKILQNIKNSFRMKYNNGIDVTFALKKMVECGNFDELY